MVSFNDLYRILNGKIYKVRAINKENKAISFFEAKCIFIPLKKRDFIHPELGTIEGYSGTILTYNELPDSNFNTLELLIEDVVYSLVLDYNKYNFGSNSKINNLAHYSYKAKQIRLKKQNEAWSNAPIKVI